MGATNEKSASPSGCLQERAERRSGRPSPRTGTDRDVAAPTIHHRLLRVQAVPSPPGAPGVDENATLEQLDGQVAPRDGDGGTEG